MKKLEKSTIAIIIITVIYSVLSFYKLGTFTNPQTFEKFEKEKAFAVFNLEGKHISKIRYYNGVNSGKFNYYVSDDLQDFTYLASNTDTYVFSWNDLNVSGEGKYLYVQATSAGIYLGEIAAYDADGKLIELTANNEKSKKLIDEQDTVPEEISYLNSTYFDEIYHARAAYEYIHNIKPYEWVHPPLGKILIGIPVMFFGMNTFSYRMMGNIAGIIMIPVMYLIAKRLFKSNKCGLIAAVIMSCDGMHFAQTRIATVDSFLVMFMMISYLFMIRYIQLKPEDSIKQKLKELFYCGLFMGFAIDTKWSAMFGAMGLAIIFFVHLVYTVIKQKRWTMNLTRIIIYCVIFFVIIPAGIYLVSYYPFFRCPDSDVKDLESLKNHQIGMYKYHAELVAEHPFTSPWYTWPILYKPVWYYVGYFNDATQKETIACLGNPVVWWGGIAGVGYLLILFLNGVTDFVLANNKKRKNKQDKNEKLDEIIDRSFKRIKMSGAILVMIATTFLCYIFIGRIMFLYHYFITLPFVMLALTALIYALDEKIKIKNINIVAILSLTAIIISFIYFFPVYSGKRVSIDTIEKTKWLDSWIY